MYLLVARQLFVMFIISVAGFAVTKAFRFGNLEQQFVSKMLVLFVNPCLIISRFDLDFEIEKFKSFLIVILLSVVVHFVMIAIALVFARSKDKEEKKLDCIDKIAFVFTNCAFIGIPLIDGALGHEAVFYLLGFVATFNIFLWTFGYLMFAGKIHFKKLILNPNIIALVIGLAIFCLPVRLPSIIAVPLNLIGDMNTCLAMILLGMLFANFKKKENVSYTIRIIKFSLIKHVVLTIAVFIIVFAAYKLFANVKDMRLICYVVYIAALCPVGMSVSSFAVIFNKDESYAALLCLVTSAISIVMLPLCIGIAEKIF